MQITSKSFSLRQLYLAAILVGICIILTYHPAFQFEYVNWDDDVHFLENPFVQSLSLESVKDIFTTTVSKTYIPLTSLSFAIEKHVFGFNPLISHGINIFLHVCVSILVLIFCRQWNLSFFSSVIAALLFALHPMHVESVAWVTERKDVLYATFYLFSIISYSKHVQLTVEGKSQRGHFLWSIIWGVLSMLAKPMALSLPLIFFLLDWFSGRKFTLSSFKEKIWTGIFIVPIAWITFFGHSGSYEINVMEAALLFLWSFTFYIHTFFFSFTLLLFYPLITPVSPAESVYYMSIFFSVIIICTLYLLRKHRLFIFAFWFYFLSTFFLYKLNQNLGPNYVADRFMYLPSLGICMLIGVVLQKLLNHSSKILIVIVCLCTLITFLGCISKTKQQLYVWSDSVSLWSHQLQNAPEATPALLYHKLSDAYMNTEAYQQAIHNHRHGKNHDVINYVINLNLRALSIKPDYGSAFYGLSKAYLDVGQSEKAKMYYASAVQFEPKYQLPKYHLKF